MGTVDVKSKKYLRQNDVFADAFNFFMYEGKMVIRPETLRECDTAELYGTEVENETETERQARDKSAAVQKYRDVLKTVVTMTDEHTVYMILGIEAQGATHYAMPVRNMVYDALRYARQVEETARFHRQSKDWSGRKRLRRGEYLSGFYKEDRLVPVLTLVMLFSPEEWDGPLSLHEMLDVQDETLLSFVPDYRVHVLTPSRLSDEALEKFHSSLREVFSFIKYSKDKRKLKEIVAENERFSQMDVSAVEVLNACVNAGIKVDVEEGKGRINMCIALEEMKEDARQEGRTEGRAEGAHDTLVENIRSLMETLQWTAEQALAALKVPKETWPEYQACLKKPVI